METTQVLLNLSSACLQINRNDEADEYSSKCVESAERAIILRQQHPQGNLLLKPLVSI
jgi:hypothetical protein